VPGDGFLFFGHGKSVLKRGVTPGLGLGLFLNVVMFFSLGPVSSVFFCIACFSQLQHV